MSKFDSEFICPENAEKSYPYVKLYAEINGIKGQIEKRINGCCQGNLCYSKNIPMGSKVIDVEGIRNDLFHNAPTFLHPMHYDRYALADLIIREILESFLLDTSYCQNRKGIMTRNLVLISRKPSFNFT